MKFSLLVSVLLPTSSSVLAYFAEANNAHVEFVSLSSSSSSSSASSSSSSTLGSDTDNGVDFSQLFEEWAHKFNKEYESLYERGTKMLNWFENHGETI